ncbi:hypothetical protein EJ03DRAFT_92270 [Teratosphaeria nubilosa]|uniref:Uncharacterized protein n=1 Tax=Teratosphaeria nubilosa TaxID=161662 RepID=A0A6G1L9A7_9PEZI|nr:hypothetical protein EJ03DRAFT_92270 [Teratosphaeria nubilosa]
MGSHQYTSWLQSPKTSLLSANARLVYITTTTEIHEPTAILKHIQSQEKHITKKEEKVLNTIESSHGLCVETQTSLLFKTSGGAYLPGIDENLLDEKLVTFPMIHIVSFDSEGKIKQIRLHWDQGSLLKQVEAIGRTGRNWPIRDGKQQIDAISKGLKAAGQDSVEGASSLPLRGPQEVVIDRHKRHESVSATRDPHASLSLFAPRDPNEEAASRSYNGPKYAPRETAKPPSRDLADIVGEDRPDQNHTRSTSPTKGGAGKNFNPNRLFDDNDENAAPLPAQKKTYKDKYEHFDFGEGEDATQESHVNGKKSSSKSQATFSFEDFTTPPKVSGRSRPDYDRQWGAGVQEDDPPSPLKRPVVHAPRKDAEPHFEFNDDSPAQADKAKSLQRQKGMGLYQDPIQHDERTAISKNSTGRRNDFAPQYEFTDEVSLRFRPAR